MMKNLKGVKGDRDRELLGGGVESLMFCFFFFFPQVERDASMPYDGR